MSSGYVVAAGLVIAATLAACATPPASRPPVARADMPGVYSNTGHMAFAHLIFRPEGTDVVVQVGQVSDVGAPVHLYTYLHQGSCASLGPQTAAATRRVLAYPETPGLSTVNNTIAVSMDTLRASPHALTVRSSPADGNKLLFCGDVRVS